MPPGKWPFHLGLNLLTYWSLMKYIYLNIYIYIYIRRLCHYWLDNGLSSLRCQAITWTNVDLISVRSTDIHLWAMSQEIPHSTITKISLKMTNLALYSNLPEANELMILYWIRVRRSEVILENSGRKHAKSRSTWRTSPYAFIMCVSQPRLKVRCQLAYNTMNPPWWLYHRQPTQTIYISHIQSHDWCGSLDDMQKLMGIVPLRIDIWSTKVHSPHYLPFKYQWVCIQGGTIICIQDWT